MQRKNVAAALEAVGIIVAAVGGFTVAPVAGFGVLGAGLILFGLATERG